MQLLTPLIPDPAAPLGRANPVAKLAAALIVMAALFASLDGVTAVVVLAGLAAVLPVSGLSPRVLLGRARLIGVIAISIGLFNILFAADQVGPIILELGPLRIGADTVVAGIGLSLRLLAIALAGLLATATSDPVEVADALIQQLRVSPRFAIGALAALRQLPLLAREWEIIGMARRARGIGGGRSPVAAVRITGSRVFGLLVSAIRRGSRLALAMEARGFGAASCRSVARPRGMHPSDWWWIVGAIGLAAAAIGTSLALGTWRPLIG